MNAQVQISRQIDAAVSYTTCWHHAVFAALELAACQALEGHP